MRTWFDLRRHDESSAANPTFSAKKAKHEVLGFFAFSKSSSLQFAESKKAETFSLKMLALDLPRITPQISDQRELILITTQIQARFKLQKTSSSYRFCQPVGGLLRDVAGEVLELVAPSSGGPAQRTSTRQARVDK